MTQLQSELACKVHWGVAWRDSFAIYKMRAKKKKKTVAANYKGAATVKAARDAWSESRFSVC